jgi:hypothetical protein
MVKRVIRANKFIADIRSGATDPQLVKKYKLSPRGLHSLLRHLVESGLITERELEEREQFTDSLIVRTFLESRREIKVIS